jgi:hypothetical protein
MIAPEPFTTSGLKDSRDGVVEYLRRELLGPRGGSDEILNDPPRVRYLLGILFPQHLEATASLDEFNDEAPGKAADTADGVPDETISTVNDWFPSALGVSFFLATGTRLRCEVWGARYEQPGKARSWKRVFIADQDEPERCSISFSSAGYGATSERVFGGLAELKSTWRPFRNGHLVTVTLINAASRAARNGEENEETRRADDAACLHQVGFRCFADGGRIAEYPSVGELGRDDEDVELALQYSHARTFAVGHGCSVSWSFDASGAVVLETEHLPTFDVPALSYDLPGFETLLRIARLIELDRPTMTAELMRFVDSYETWALRLRAVQVPSHFDGAKQRILLRLTDAVQRMQRGVTLISEDDNVLRAFRLANEAMLLQMHQTKVVIDRKAYARNTVDIKKPSYESLEYAWRPFQLAFQLLTLASMANDDDPDRDVVDLIWFATGGGKTECYLAMAAFVIFLRRLRHGNAGCGTSVITRYTLTLLTAQQFQRAATLICACEWIRAQNDDLAEVPIRIGLWVGHEHAPNHFADAAAKFDEILVEGEVRNPFQLQQCPWCGTNVVPQEGTGDRDDYGIRADDTSFAFYCPTDYCDFHEKLPVSVIDEDLYREPPALLLATVDKFAALPWDERAGSFFGRGRYLSPSLIIQDELHLLSGPLGTTVGLYETAVESLISLHGSQPKIIASTATIRRAGDQISGLFGRPRASVFPPAGLSANDSYFSKTDDSKPGRRYLGIMPQSHSTQTSMVNTVSSLLEVPMECELDEDEIDAYWTIVVYHNSLRELGRTVTLAHDDIPERLPLWASTPEKIRKLSSDEVMELRSNVGGDKLPTMLMRMTKPRSDPDAVSLVACTNMFSVGVDVARLGLMLMNGQPKSTSEYIQATSRVGRGNVPGIVAVLYGSTRPRDRSHYEQFISFHQALYKKVEPTSVTPFSPPSRDRALHAALVTLMRHWGGLQADDSATQFQSSDARTLRVREEILRRAARCDATEAAATESHLDKLIAEWHAAAAECRAAGRTLYFKHHGRQHRNLLSDYGKSQGIWRTLRSMRNVDGEAAIAVIGAH